MQRQSRWSASLKGTMVSHLFHFNASSEVSSVQRVQLVKYVLAQDYH